MVVSKIERNATPSQVQFIMYHTAEVESSDAGAFKPMENDFNPQVDFSEIRSHFVKLIHLYSCRTFSQSNLHTIVSNPAANS